MSAYWDILSAARTVLAALPGMSGVTFVIRKRLYADPNADRDSLPLGVLAPESEDINGLTFSNQAFVDYPVLFGLFHAGNHAVGDTTTLQSELDKRDAARKALHKPSLSGVATVFDANYDPAPVVDLQGQDNLFDVSVQRFVFRNSEDRSA